MLKGGDDKFSLKKAQPAVEKANLDRLQATLDKIPGHIRGLTKRITEAESDIKKADEIPKSNADALKDELGGKYVAACIPIIGFFTAIGINSRIKTFKSAFSGTNQIYKDLGNALFEKNKKMSIVAMIIGAILGLGSLILFAVSGGPIVISLILLIACAITVLMLFSTGKKLKSYLNHSTGGNDALNEVKRGLSTL